MKLLKNLHEFYQSFAQIIFAPDEKKQQTKEKNQHGHGVIGVPHDLLPYFSHLTKLFSLFA
jgi:hypothetical protein